VLLEPDAPASAENVIQIVADFVNELGGEI